MSSQPRRVGSPRNVSPPAWGGPVVQRDRPPKLKHHGGQVLGAVEVFPIYWGRFWRLAAGETLSSELNRFFDVILASEMMEKLSRFYTHEMQITHGRRVGALTEATANPGTLTNAGQMVTDAHVQAGLRSLIFENKAPAPNPNTLYFIYLPPGVTSQQGSLESCRDYCGYHGSTANVPHRIRYVVEASLGCASCSFGSDLASLTKSSSHDLWEAITDPDLDAWFDPYTGEEVSDLSIERTTRIEGFLVQDV